MNAFIFSSITGTTSVLYWNSRSSEHFVRPPVNTMKMILAENRYINVIFIEVKKLEPF